MSDAQNAYDNVIAFSSALRMSVNYTSCVLQALVIKGVLAKQEALAILGDAERVALQSTSANAAQIEIAEATFQQVRVLFNRM
jgi:hypothetical protein